jgi:hypothetical protein
MYWQGHRDQDEARRGESVDRQHPEDGRRVDDHVVVAGEDRGKLAL